MIKKIFLSILIILATISFIYWVIYINQEPAPQPSPVQPEIKKEQVPAVEEIKPEPPPVSEDMKKEQKPVSKEIKKKKPTVAEEKKKEQPPVPEETKKEQPPVPEEIKKEKAPIPEKSLKEISKLQEKCDKRSKKIFHNEYNDGSIENNIGLFLYKYKNNYNKKLDKCFMVITEDGVSERYKKLLDVDENNSYGSVRVNNEQENLGCYVLEKKCNSEKGWDSIVKPYMEE